MDSQTQAPVVVVHDIPIRPAVIEALMLVVMGLGMKREQALPFVAETLTQIFTTGSDVPIEMRCSAPWAPAQRNH